MLSRATTELQAAHKKLRYYSEHLSQLVEERTAEAVDAHIRQRKAEEESQSRAKLLDKAHDAIMVTDYDGQIKYWNKGAERLYGWTAAEVAGQDRSGRSCTTCGTRHPPKPCAPSWSGGNGKVRLIQVDQGWRRSASSRAAGPC